MSVIVVGMEMPKSCGGCNASGTGVCRKWFDVKELGSKRSEDCPLKSVDGLIEEIEGSIEELRKYNEQLHYRSNFHGTPEIHSISGQIAGLLKTVEIIKTYCGMEEEK